MATIFVIKIDADIICFAYWILKVKFERYKQLPYINCFIDFIINDRVPKMDHR